MENKSGGWLGKLNRMIYRLDSISLGWIGFIQLAVVLLPHLAKAVFSPYTTNLTNQ